MLNREENQKAVDGASQVISVTEGGSCRKASTQGRVADPGFRVWEMVRGRGPSDLGSQTVQRGRCNSVPCGAVHRLLGKSCQSDFTVIFRIFKWWLRLTLCSLNSKVCNLYPHQCGGDKDDLGPGCITTAKASRTGVGEGRRRTGHLPLSAELRGTLRPQQLAVCHVLLPSSRENGAHRRE